MNTLINKLEAMTQVEGLVNIGFHAGVHTAQGQAFVSGWWEYDDGGEGGDLELWANLDDNVLEIVDYDGAYDLPQYIKDELALHDIVCDWGNA